MKNKVILIGWDAADWHFINPLLKENKMPCLEKFISEGIHGNIASIQPMLSPMLWTSIATGKRGDSHGIHGFVEPSDDGQSIRPATSSSRKCKAIWNILNQNKLRCNIVNWFASHPAENINGYIVSNLYPDWDSSGKFPSLQTSGIINSSLLESELSELRLLPSDINSEEIQMFIPNLASIDLSIDKRPYQLQQLLAKTASIHNAATYLLSKKDWDFTAIYYGAIDQFGHEFMQYHPPKLNEVNNQDFENYKYVMENIYRYHDMMLHGLLQNIDSSTNIIIVSDHGYISNELRPKMESARKLPESCHRYFGIACANGPDFKKGEKLYGATILDVTPTILSLFDLPVGDDMEGRIWQETFDNPNNIKRTLSWELVPGKDGMHSENLKNDPIEMQSLLQQFIDLGYIDEPSKDIKDTIDNVIRDQKTNLARSLIDSGKIDQAIPLLEFLYQSYSNEIYYITKLVECYIQTDDLNNARKYLNILKQKGNNSNAYVYLLEGSLAMAQNKADQAVKSFNTALAESDSNAILLNNLIGRAYLILNKFELAKKAYTKVLQIEPENPFAHNGLAQSYIATKNYKKAVEHSLDAVGLLHFFPAAHYHLGVALAEIGKPIDAISAFEVCLPMAKQKSQVHYWLSKLYQINDLDHEKSKIHKRLAASENKKNKFFFINKDS